WLVGALPRSFIDSALDRRARLQEGVVACTNRLVSNANFVALLWPLAGVEAFVTGSPFGKPTFAYAFSRGHPGSPRGDRQSGPICRFRVNGRSIHARPASTPLEVQGPRHMGPMSARKSNTLPLFQE